MNRQLQKSKKLNTYFAFKEQKKQEEKIRKELIKTAFEHLKSDGNNATIQSQ